MLYANCRISLIRVMMQHTHALALQADASSRHNLKNQAAPLQTKPKGPGTFPRNIRVDTSDPLTQHCPPKTPRRATQSPPPPSPPIIPTLPPELPRSSPWPGVGGTVHNADERLCHCRSLKPRREGLGSKEHSHTSIIMMMATRLGGEGPRAQLETPRREGHQPGSPNLKGQTRQDTTWGHGHPYETTLRGAINLYSSGVLNIY